MSMMTDSRVTALSAPLSTPSSAPWSLDPLDLTAPTCLSEADQNRFFASLGQLSGDAVATTPTKSMSVGEPLSGTALPLRKMEHENSTIVDFGAFANMLYAGASTTDVATVPTTPHPLFYSVNAANMGLGDEEDSGQGSVDSPEIPDGYGYNYNVDSPQTMMESQDSGPHRGRRKGSPAFQTKRRYPRSHTCKEPQRSECKSDLEFLQAWNAWRHLRNRNNEAVRRSRKAKKARISCTEEACVAMYEQLKSAEKTRDLLLKAACDPQMMTRTEKMAYKRLILSHSSLIHAAQPPTQ